MAGTLGSVAKGVARLFGEGTVSGLDDGQLLQRFVSAGDAVAFESLVARHGPMVLAVCRRTIRDDHSADDAFQATFLLLVRKARTIRATESLGPWLHRVAMRISVRVNRGMAKRRARELSSPAVLDRAATPEPPDRELSRALHEAVDSLPEKYRAPIVMCYLEGRTHDEAAISLRWPIGSVKGRLARAREVLKVRLARRGVLAPAAAIVAGLSTEARASVPSILHEATIEAAIRFAAGEATATLAAGMSSAGAAVLAGEVSRAMTIKKLVTIAASVAAMLGLMGGGAAVLARQDGGKLSNVKNEEPKVADAKKSDEPKTDLDRLQGHWARTRGEVGDKEIAQLPQLQAFEEIIIRGDQLTDILEGGKLATSRSLKLDPSKQPKQFEWRRLGADEEEEVTRGIYLIKEDDVFLLSYDAKNPSRLPGDFSTKAEIGRVTMEFRRIPKPPEPSAEQKAELAKLQGEWTYMGGETNGTRFSSGLRGVAMYPTHRLVFEGNRRFVLAGDGPGREVQFDSPGDVTLDLAKKPHVLERRVTREQERRNGHFNEINNYVQRSNYKLNGDTLIFCSNTSGIARASSCPEDLATDSPPGELVTRPGDDRVLSIYKRIAPTTGDLKRLQGIWEVSSVRVRGNDRPQRALFNFKDDNWAGMQENGTVIFGSRIQLDESLNPPVLTCGPLPVSGMGATHMIYRIDGDTVGDQRVSPGINGATHMIYRIDSDTLTLCGKDRDPRNGLPTKFSAEKGEDQWLIVANRKATPPPAAAKSADEPKGDAPRRLNAPQAAVAQATDVSVEAKKGDVDTGAQVEARLRQQAADLVDGRAQALTAVDVAEMSIDVLREEMRATVKQIRGFELRLINLHPESEDVAVNRNQITSLIAQYQNRLAETRQTISKLRQQLHRDQTNADRVTSQIEAILAKADEAALRPGKPNTAQVGDSISVDLLEALPGRPIAGERLVRHDGTISLKFYGDLPVVGLTRAEIKVKFIEHMHRFITDESLGLISQRDDNGKAEVMRVPPADSDRVAIDIHPKLPSRAGIADDDLERRIEKAIADR